jgi:hypothetical protein
VSAEFDGPEVTEGKGVAHLHYRVPGNQPEPARPEVKAR